MGASVLYVIRTHVIPGQSPFLRDAVPYFYIPLSAIEKGPGVFTKGNSGGKGYWISSLQIGGKDVEFAAFEQGPLAGLVKLTREGVGMYLPLSSLH